MRLLSFALLLLFLLTACAPPNGQPQEGSKQPLTVAAASDLQYAFAEIGRLFEQQTGQPVVFSFGSTGNLAKQIEHGAPIDLFFAANVSFVDGLIQQGMLLPETKQLYARGGLALAVNLASGVLVTDLDDLALAHVKRIAIANPEHAPYGLAAKEALISARLWEQVQPKLVYGENIRQALQFVQTGNAEVGLIARSVADVPEISYTMVAEHLHNPLVQALAIAKGSPHMAAAQEFAAFVMGPDGQRILQRYGFAPPEGG